MKNATRAICAVLALYAAVLVAGAASAAAGGTNPLDGLKVDPEQVVESGAVAPVDGITSAGQPSAAALEVFADAGYVAVIDLRGLSEDRGFDERSRVDELGMHYRSLPIDGAAAVNFANARKLDQMLQSFDGPVLIHCSSGNRVGALLALRRFLHGADRDEAIEYGRAAGLTGLEPEVEKQMAQRPN